VRLVTLGVGAQNSPRYAPAGLLVAHGGVRVMIDGGPRAVAPARLDAWLVTDLRGELIAAIRRLAEARGLVPYAGPFSARGVRITPRKVAHTSHPTWGYRIEVPGLTVVWAPEFYEFPRWARGADLMFAEAAAWNRPIRFAGGVGGHLDVQAVARAARRHGVRRLVFAHIGRPTLRALDRGLRPAVGEFATDRQAFVPGRRRCQASPGDQREGGRAHRAFHAPQPPISAQPSAHRVAGSVPPLVRPGMGRAIEPRGPESIRVAVGRTEMTTQTFYRTVARTGHQEDRTIVQRATAAVFHALRDRLTPNEADQVFAQLPEPLKRIWGEGEEAEREPIKMNREEFCERVLRDAGLPSKREARWMILAVFAALKEQISPGEARDVMAQLPKDLKELWDEAQAEV
jgi:uncharacterized protein (DUF2267 family)